MNLYIHYNTYNFEIFFRLHYNVIVDFYRFFVKQYNNIFFGPWYSYCRVNFFDRVDSYLSINYLHRQHLYIFNVSNKV